MSNKIFYPIHFNTINYTVTGTPYNKGLSSTLLINEGSKTTGDVFLVILNRDNHAIPTTTYCPVDIYLEGD